MKDRKVVRCRSIGTATGRTTHREHIASVTFTDPDNPYVDHDAMAYRSYDPSIQAKLTKRPQGWTIEDVTDGEWELVKNANGTPYFESVPEAVGRWLWGSKTAGHWFAYGRD